VFHPKSLLLHAAYQWNQYHVGEVVTSHGEKLTQINIFVFCKCSAMIYLPVFLL